MFRLASIAAFVVLSSNTYAAPGHLWEFGMEMVGMPFAMPKQKVCAPKESKEPPVQENNGECKILDKKMTGNRFQWKAECKDGTLVGDVTSTPTSYQGTMKMTQKSGEVMDMKMSGKRIGDCDYQDRSNEIKAMQKQSDDQLAKMCADALENMQGQIIVGEGSLCPAEKPVFCKRLSTVEGYGKATAHIPATSINDPVLGVVNVAKGCGLDNTKLLPKLCNSAVGDSNYAFVSRLCPAEKPKLCSKAAADLKLSYVGANCPTEKAALAKQHCEGRMYSNQVEPKFQDFCANVASGGTMTDDESGHDSSSDESNAEPSRQNNSPGIPVDVQESVKKLKGLFGF